MTHSVSTLKYHATKGLPWERLIIVKDKVSRRVQKPIDAWGVVKTGEVTRKEFATKITSEGGIVIYLSEEDTYDLPEGDLEFDVVAVIPTRSLYTGTVNVTKPVAKGTLVVSALDTYTPLEESDYMELRFKQYEDFYRTFTWKDENGDVIDVQNAYMQAKNTGGTTVLDIRWYAPPAPSDATIGALTGNRRGYITENQDSSITLHISNLNTVPAGEHRYDMFVQDNSGDWTCLASGVIVVEESISVMPA
jgi:hypothetical protein